MSTTYQVHTAPSAPGEIIVRICREATETEPRVIVWYCVPNRPGGWNQRRKYRGHPHPQELQQMEDRWARRALELVGFQPSATVRVGGEEMTLDEFNRSMEVRS